MHSNIHNKYQKDNLQSGGESGWKLQLVFDLVVKIKMKHFSDLGDLGAFHNAVE